VNCGCRCIKCKSKRLESFSFVAKDGFDDIHHTCLACGTHFDHLDGQIYITCQVCKFFPSEKSQQ
jgi:predicted Zn-ribbon and HTH transcriptional regulator